MTHPQKTKTKTKNTPNTDTHELTQQLKRNLLTINDCVSREKRKSKPDQETWEKYYYYYCKSKSKTADKTSRM